MAIPLLHGCTDVNSLQGESVVVTAPLQGMGAPCNIKEESKTYCLTYWGK